MQRPGGLMRFACLLLCVAACGNIARKDDDQPEPDAPGPALTITATGDGSGTVTSDPAGINCGTDCTESFPIGSSVVLTATAAAGATFTGWTGAGCTGTGTCTITITGGDLSVQAAFAKHNAL